MQFKEINAREGCTKIFVLRTFKGTFRPTSNFVSYCDTSLNGFVISAADCSGKGGGLFQGIWNRDEVSDTVPVRLTTFIVHLSVPPGKCGYGKDK
jgi:hypothetical protein